MRNILNKENVWDVIVIGGGPAGMMAAGRASELARAAKMDNKGASKSGAKILLLEKNDKLGKKLLITGGGRCNVTNAEFNTRAFLAKFKDSDKFLFSAFAQHGVKETFDFFHEHGMETITEAEQRVFPKTEKSQSVWDVMVSYIKIGQKDGTAVTVRSNAPAAGFIQTKKSGKNGGTIEAVKLENGELIHGRNFILATGGLSHPETGSTGDGFAWLKKLGHTIREPRAALVPIEVSDIWVKKLSGFSLPEAKLTIFGATEDGADKPAKKSKIKGKILFTHFGLSGPAVLNMSNEVAELLKYGPVSLSLDLLPQHDYATLNAALVKLFADESNKIIKNALCAAGTDKHSLIPTALVPAVLEKTKIDGETPCHSVTREERLTLVNTLKDMRITPTGLLGAEKAIITSGGVAPEEIDWKTMRSRLVPNLQIVGDVLDIDRPSGGYSLQLCWTTGWVAGSNVDKYSI